MVARHGGGTMTSSPGSKRKRQREGLALPGPLLGQPVLVYDDWLYSAVRPRERGRDLGLHRVGLTGGSLTQNGVLGGSQGPCNLGQEEGSLLG